MLEPLQGADLIRYASKVAGYLGSAYSGEPRDIIKALIKENASLRESLHLIASTSNDAGAREEARCALGVSSSREALLEKGYKTDSRCTWLAIGRCADCGRIHDGRPHGVAEVRHQTEPPADADDAGIGHE